MKRIIIILSLFIFTVMLISFKSGSDDPKKKLNDHSLPYEFVTIDIKKMDANNISAWYRNNGIFNNYNPYPYSWNSGFEWPKGSNKYARYASGLWIGAEVGDDTLVCLAEYNTEYLPGYIDNNGNPQGADDPLRRIYVLNKGDTTGMDYLNWPVNQGAYVNENGKPYLIGNQTMFYTYTDGYPEVHYLYAGGTAPLKAQILQTNWCYNEQIGMLKNVTFTEYRIINRDTLPWTNCYISQWTDDDLGYGYDDAVGCDTNIDLGYTYNFDNDDLKYGLNPPAVGFIFLRGGMIESPGDTLKYYSPPGSNNLIRKAGYKISGMSSFFWYQGGTDPRSYVETYYNLQGLRRDGTPWVNPITNQITTFPLSGDPESGTGWLMFNVEDIRSLLTTGPVNVNPGDTQIITIAQIIARGSNHLNSVTKLKQSARVIQRFFDNNFDVSVNSPLPITSSYAPGTGNIYLSWNDSCERVTMQNKLSGGIYKFQGYNLYRIRPNNITQGDEDTILIKTFDIKDLIKDIRDSIYIDEYSGIVYGIVQRGSDNGISRYIVLDKDTVSGSAFVNGTEYKFAVTAYYYDSLGGIYSLPRVYESPKYSNIIKVIPQNISPGTQVSYNLGDTIKTDQKDLAVMPVVFRPFELINANYTSTFGMTDSVTSWTLTRNANGNFTTLFLNVKDFSGVQDTAKSVDGFLLVHQYVRDSGIVRDPENRILDNSRNNFYTMERAWTYDPPQNLWIEGPDTQAVKTAKVITNRQFESRSIGMSFPTLGNFRNNKTRILANGKFFSPVSGQNVILTGGPLRKIRIVFGQNSKSYRYVPQDSNFSSALYSNMVNVPFSVFAIDELDSSVGNPRQLNTGFMDTDNDGIWDPDTSKLGNYQFTYLFASTYNPDPQIVYTTKNPGLNSPALGFPSMDVMYAWLPRVKKSSDGTPLTFTNGDRLTVSPYRITRPEFVPGYHIKYNWSVTGTQSGNLSLASAETEKIKAFPNPYYGTSELEYDSGGEKFIYFSHLPAQCVIYIYTLNGSLVKKIERNSSDPENSLEKWDLQNSGGQRVASGMYVVYVDCKGAGTKILKIAVFTSK